MHTSATSPVATTLPPAPSGVGDWLDSSFELQRGVLVQELPLQWWDDCLAATHWVTAAAPQAAH